jgi:hypothetical protein
MTKTKLLLHVIDSTLASTARTVRAVVLLLALAVAAGPVHDVDLLRLGHAGAAPTSTAGVVSSVDHGVQSSGSSSK